MNDTSLGETPSKVTLTHSTTAKAFTGLLPQESSMFSQTLTRNLSPQTVVTYLPLKRSGFAAHGCASW